MSDRRELQHKMDVEKWLESETRHFDMCGSYDYCAYCDKSEENPCANALIRMTGEDEPAPAEEETLGKKVDAEKISRKRAARKSLSFAEKYSLQSDEVKARYAVLRAAGWRGTSAPYTQTVSVSIVKNPSIDGYVGLAETVTTQQWNAAALARFRKTAQGNGTITITAEGDRPAIDIPITVVLTGMERLDDLGRG